MILFHRRGRSLLRDAPRPLQEASDALWARFAPNGAPHRVGRLLFTGVDPEVGTTTVAACTAVGLARHLRESVVIVEADVRAPRLADVLGLVRLPGLAEVLQRSTPLSKGIRPTGVPGLHALPAGLGAGLAPGDFVGPVAASVFAALADRFRFVVIDAPPVRHRAETRLLLRHAEEAILVARAESTERSAAADAVRILEDAGVPFAGVVLNAVRSGENGRFAVSWRT